MTTDEELAANALRQASKQVTISDGKVTASTLTDHSDKERLASALESGDKRIVGGGNAHSWDSVDVSLTYLEHLEKQLALADEMADEVEHDLTCDMVCREYENGVGPQCTCQVGRARDAYRAARGDA